MLFLVKDRVVDLARREVRHNDRRLEVEPRAFDLLVYLIANRDRLVTKDDLIAEVWRGRIVSDSALASALNAARSAIGDNGQQQRLIRTSARQGFRFVAPVAATGRAGKEPAPEDAPGVPSVVVMPFLNLGDEPDQDYFIDGPGRGPYRCASALQVAAGGAAQRKLRLEGQALRAGPGR